MFSPFFVNYVRASARSSLQYFIWLNQKEYRDIFGCEKCKVTFGFKYRFITLEWLKRSSNGQLGNTTMLIVR